MSRSFGPYGRGDVQGSKSVGCCKDCSQMKLLLNPTIAIALGCRANIVNPV
jgi:hypothetical protein